MSCAHRVILKNWKSHRFLPAGALLLAAGILLFASQRSAHSASQEAVTGTPEMPQATTLPGLLSTPTGSLSTPAEGQATPSATPWQFAFPTPAPAPVSAWRPPLYDVPWAPGPNDHFFFTRPIAADEVNWPLADYRYGGIEPGTNIVHTGIDIDAPLGTEVLAAGNGTVVWAGYGLFRGVYDTQDPYGLAVAIRHPFGYHGQRLFTVYAHMRKISVKVGQAVARGESLGEVGETGKVTGPHLHFEVRVGENDYFYTRNPELWLAPPQGWGVLAGRIMNTSGSYITSQDILVKNAEGTRFWAVRTYGREAVNSDAYYLENIVLSDLPAGDYIIWVEYLGGRYNLTVTIRPGQVTYFTFTGRNLFHNDLPHVEPFRLPAP